MENKSNFIGTGKQFGKKVQVTFEWETLKKLNKNEFKGKKYLTVDVLPLKEKDQYGKTHTVIEHVPFKKEEAAEDNNV